MPCFIGRKTVEKALKKRDKLLEESERKALKEEYEYLGLRISSGRGGGGTPI